MGRVEVEGAQIYYEVAGDGPALAFCSETAGSGEYWKLAQVPHLSARFRTVVHDYRGVGRSSRPEGPYSTAQFASDLLAVLDDAGITEPIHLLGHSMGGRVAQRFALEYPERVRSLILFATGSGNYLGRTMSQGIAPEFVDQVVREGWPTYHHLALRREFVDQQHPALASYLACFDGAFATDLLGYARHVEARSQHETTPRLAELACPTLVLVGAQDLHAGVLGSHLDSSRYLAGAIPGAEFVLLEEGSHAVHVEFTEAFHRALEHFLDRH